MLRRAFFALFQWSPWTPPDQQSPACPVCRTAGTWPNAPLTLADPDGVYRGMSFPRTRVFVCMKCGAIYAAAFTGQIQ